MYKSEFALLAKDVVIDQTTKAVSIFNVIEDIVASGPLLLPEVSFFALISKQQDDPMEGKAQFHISINNKELVDMPVAFNFNGVGQQSRLVIKIQGLPIPEPGILLAKLSNDDSEQLAGYQITIRPSNKPPALKVESIPSTDTPVAQE